MNSMVYVALAALFGASVGVIITSARGWLVTFAADAVLVIGVGFAIWGQGSMPNLGFVIAAGGLIAAFFAGGVVWKDHPLLAGASYWTRVWAAFRHGPMLRRSLQSNTAELGAEKSSAPLRP